MASQSPPQRRVGGTEKPQARTCNKRRAPHVNRPMHRASQQHPFVDIPLIKIYLDDSCFLVFFHFYHVKALGGQFLYYGTIMPASLPHSRRYSTGEDSRYYL